MGPLKCCVSGCNATSETTKLFCFPVKDSWRSLWMSFLMPSNPHLIGLTKEQLMKKRVCERHFDREMFFDDGRRIKYSYPCLFSSEEIAHGIPLSTTDWHTLSEHNYCKVRDEDEVELTESSQVIGKADDGDFVEHSYCLNPKTTTLAIGGEFETEIEQKDSKHSSQREKESKCNAPQINIDLQPQSQLIECKKYKKEPSISRKQQFSSKTRQYIKKCLKIAKDSLGKTGGQRLQSSKEHADNMMLFENFEKLNKRAKAFLLMQLRLARKNKMGRRFTLQDKLFALSLMKQSPKAYKLLANIFALPNKRTLARLSGKIEFDCGINEKIFDYLKNITKNWDTKKRICSLVFDEVAITPHLTYNERKDKIIGFVEVAEPKRKFADHALVLMVRGICSSWRQCIAYFFCESSVSAPELEIILKQIIPRLFCAGLTPLALVCDQGSTFRACYKSLKQSTARIRTKEGRELDDTVHIAGHDLFIFHDPPHLLKGLRNNFLDKDILFQGKRATWRDITIVYDLDSKSGYTRALPKLTVQHVNPAHIKKMQVKAAAQVFSARTAAMLNYTHTVYEHLNAPTNTMENTAALVSFFDDLFDSVNGSPGAVKGKLRCAVKPDSPHQAFWRESIIKLKNMFYIDTKSKRALQAGKPRHVRVPCLEGWNTTLKSFLGMAKVLFSEYGVEYFYPRFINQDPLENFFGQVRAVNYRNNNPDANMFVHSFKSIVLSNILTPHSKNANCEEDDGDTLIDCNYLFTSPPQGKENIPPNYNVNAPSSSVRPPHIGTVATTTQNIELDSVIIQKVSVQTSAYTAGYICRKIFKKTNCHNCKKTITTNEILGIHKYIQYREFKRLKNSNLSYPCEKILRLYRETTDIIHNFLNLNCHNNKIKVHLKSLIKSCDMSWMGCTKHKLAVKNYYASLMVRLHCHNFCTIINKILNGKIPEKYVCKMHQIHLDAYNKYKTHRLRNKKMKF